MVALNVLGLNCGTSVDGIDVALCRISTVCPSGDVKIDLLSFIEIPVSPKIRAQILRLCRPNQAEAGTCMAEVCDLSFALGREFSRAILESGVNLDEVDLIASHGQTLWHQPLGKDRSTLQMAEPAVISQVTKKTVISGFRAAELAAGRQGAPLAGFFEHAVLCHASKTRICQNIGGIGNASVLPATGRFSNKDLDRGYLAFDTGPGNVFIDAAMRILTNGEKHFDCDGDLGKQGESQIDEAFVNKYIESEPYFQLKPPKTTGRELFSDDVARGLVNKLKAAGKSDEAIIATITRITAESIARAYEQHVLPQLHEKSSIDEVYICGGGAHNPNILKHLQARLPHSKVLKMNDAPVAIDPSAKEAVMFALLGFLCVMGWRVLPPADAESLEPTVMGMITPGRNYHAIMKKVVGNADFGEDRVLGSVKI